MQKLVWQNAKGEELDLTGGNYGITEWEGFSNTSLNIQSQQVPFQDGGVFLDALIEQRELTVTLAIQDNNNLSLRYQQRRELISALNPKLGEGYLIYTNDYISKRIKCIPQIPIFETHNSDTVGTPKASLSWTACSPYWEDLEETSAEIDLGEVTTIENQGDTKTGVKMRIENQGITNPVIKNLTTNQKIKIDGMFNETIDINTKFGEKSIVTEKQVYTWTQGGKLKYIAESDFMLLLAGDSIITTPDGENWKSVDVKVPENYIWQINGMIYVEEQEMFIVLGTERYSYGFIQTSKDGINWEYISLSFVPYTIVYVDGYYYSSSGDTNFYKSEDLVNWTSIYSGTKFIKMIYSKNQKLFVGLKENSSTLWDLYTSPDGITWTQRTTATNTNYRFSDICYSENKSIFCGATFNGKIYISYDAITWTEKTSNITTKLNSAFYSELKNIFVLVGANGVVVTSEDGEIWTVQTSGTTDEIYCSVYSKIIGKLIFSTIKGSIYQSTDGVQWSTKLKGIDGALMSVIYVSEKEKYYAVGRGVIYESSDGKEWTQVQTNIPSTHNHRSIAYHNQIFVIDAHKFEDNRLYYGTDFSSLNYINASAESLKYNEAINKFLGLEYISNEGSYMITSEDGETWERSFLTQYETEFIQYFERLGLYIATAGSKRIFTSPDGITWTQRNYQYDGGTIYSIADNGRILVAVGTREILTSSDGITWVNRLTASSSLEFYSVKYDSQKGLFVAVGSSSYHPIVYVSENGILWTRIEVDSNSILRDVEVTGDIIIVGEVEAVAGAETGGIILRTYNQEGENIINNLTSNSDMTFCLEKGNNKLQFLYDAGSGKIIITYRQKYIGV